MITQLNKTNMKRLLLTLGAISFGLFAMAQSEDEKAIKIVILSFSEAGDAQDVKALSACLDDNYRIVMNQLFGSTEVNIMPKDIYLNKIEAKEFGGDTRSTTVEQIVINGNTASAKVQFKGKRMTFVSIIGLVKNAVGDWKMVSEVPVIQG